MICGVTCRDLDWCNGASMSLMFAHPLPRTTAPEEPEEGPWQVSVVPAPADEVAAEHCANTEVSPAPRGFLPGSKGT